jgi:uncharacterized membrane protein YebE (DUF533 family)
MIDPSLLVNDVLRGVLGGRRKRSRKALRYLTGRRGIGGALLSNPNALLTVAGLAWGVFETLNQPQSSVGSVGSGGPGSGGSPVPPLPNLPGVQDVPADAVRIIRLAISAASVDGVVSERERQAIIEHATDPTAAALLATELSRRQVLSEIVSGVTDPTQRATLYVLAYSVLRADDEQISGAELIYLAQLAHLLGLTPEDVQTLETDAGKRIDEQE